MKKLSVISLILILPFAVFSQRRCDEYKVKADSYLALPENNKNRLDSALYWYLEAINCNPKLQAGENGIGVTIQNVFAKIEKQRLEAIADRNHAYKLLSYFFDEDAQSVPVKERAAWVQGPNGKYAVMKWDANLYGEDSEKDEYVWEEPHRFENGTAIAKRGGLYYFVDNNGKITSDGFDMIHKTCFVDESQSKDNSSSIRYDFGVQKTVGKPIEMAIDPITGKKYQSIRILKEGAYAASDSVFPFELDGRWGLMRNDGSKVLSERFTYVGNLYGGFARINQGGTINDTTGQITGGKWGYINARGKTVKEPQYADVGEVIDSITWVQDMDSIYRILDVNEFSSLEPAIDSKNEREIRGKNLNKLYKRRLSDKIINNKGDLGNNSSNSRQTNVRDIVKVNEDNLITFKKQGKSLLIEKFRLNDQYGIRNPSGEIVLPAKYDEIRPTSKASVYITRQRALFGLEVLDVDIKKSKSKSKGATADTIYHRFRSLACDYDEIGDYRQINIVKGSEEIPTNYVRVKQNGKWGYVFWDWNKEKEVYEKRLIPCQYDVATDFYNHDGKQVARVYIKEFRLYFYINTNGQMLAKMERDSIFR